VRILAELLEAVEEETPYGGHAVSFAPLGPVWMKVDGRRRRERTEAGGPGVVEGAAAEVGAFLSVASKAAERSIGKRWADQAMPGW
jgi:hypothetical protein